MITVAHHQRGPGTARRTAALPVPALTMMLALTAALALATAPLTAGCGRKQQASSGGAAKGAGQSGSQANGQANGRSAGPGRAGAAPPAPVAVQPAFLGSIASIHKATASLEAEKQADILARVGGVVEALGCEEGDRVSAGAVLLRIENDEYRLRAEQAAARTANLAARAKRLADMRAHELASEEEFETARSELAAAEAEEGLARLNLSYTEVTAPFGGRVVRRLVNVGQTVSAGTPLFTLADFDPLLARVHVPAKEFHQLAVGQPVELALDSSRRLLRGRIKLVSPVIDTASGTIKVTVEIAAAAEDIRPGDFAEVRIVTERRDGAVLVPRAAVVSDRGEDVVFVAAAGDTAQRRTVALGFTDADHAQIVAGVQPGERVVVKGQRALKAGDPLKILEGGAPASAAADSAAAADSSAVIAAGDS